MANDVRIGALSLENPAHLGLVRTAHDEACNLLALTYSLERGELALLADGLVIGLEGQLKPAFTWHGKMGRDLCLEVVALRHYVGEVVDEALSSMHKRGLGVSEVTRQFNASYRKLAPLWGGVMFSRPWVQDRLEGIFEEAAKAERGMDAHRTEVRERFAMYREKLFAVMDAGGEHVAAAARAAIAADTAEAKLYGLTRKQTNARILQMVDSVQKQFGVAEVER